MCYGKSQSVGDLYLLFLLYSVRCHKTENEIYNNEYLQISLIIYIWLPEYGSIKKEMMHFLKTFHRIALRAIDVGSDVAIKMKYTH